MFLRLKELRRNFCLQLSFWVYICTAIYFVVSVISMGDDSDGTFSKALSVLKFQLYALYLVFLSPFEFLIRKYLLKQNPPKEPTNKALRILDRIYTVLIFISSTSLIFIYCFFTVLFAIGID